MRVTPTSLPGVVIVAPDVHRDPRGYFYERYNAREFARAVADVTFVQDNVSGSVRHVLRGLHYQMEEAQGRLVHVTAGAVFDVAVDLRRSSPTFGRWAGHTLSADSHESVWIPAGFAHGFLVLSDTAQVEYKATAYWAPEHERCIAWDDADLAIAWPLTQPPILSERDRRGLPLRQAEVFA